MFIKFQLSNHDVSNINHMSLTISCLTADDATDIMSVLMAAKIAYVFDETDKLIRIEGGSQILNVLDCLSYLPRQIREKINNRETNLIYHTIKESTGSLRPISNEMLSQVTKYLPPVSIYHLAKTCHYFWQNHQLRREFKRKTAAKYLVASRSMMFTLYDNGSVYACGCGDGLGLGHNNVVNTPTLISSLEGKTIRKIFSKDGCTFFLCADGIYACGQNVVGQLGMGHNDNVSVPTKVTALANKSVRNIILMGGLLLNATYFICDQEVYVCGENTFGNLGIGLNTSVNVPTKVSVLDGKEIREIVIDGLSCYYICNDGVYACGDNKLGKLGLGHNRHVNVATKLIALEDNTLLSWFIDSDAAYFICKDGVYVCGDNRCGELGLGHNNAVYTPAKVTALEGKIIRNIRAVSHSTYFVCNDGVYVCGSNRHGELGLGHTNTVDILTKVTAIEGKILRDIVTGYYAAYFMCDDGVYVSGSNREGNLGLGHNNPVSLPTKIVALDGKVVHNIIGFPLLFHAFYICHDDLYMPNFASESAPAVYVPIKSNTFHNKTIQSVITGDDAIYFICDDGIYVFGSNEAGQLGLGHTNPQLIPVRLDNPLRRDITLAATLPSLMDRKI